jgi:hypothetical protein
MRYLFSIVLFLSLLSSCNFKNNCPTNKVFEINFEIDKSSLIRNGYKLNPDGFPVLGNTFGDTLFLYALDNEDNVDFREASFIIDDSFCFKDFLSERNCLLIDSLTCENEFKYLIKNNVNDLDFRIKIDKSRNRIYIRFYFPR